MINSSFPSVPSPQHEADIWLREQSQTFFGCNTSVFRNVKCVLAPSLLLRLFNPEKKIFQILNLNYEKAKQHH